MWIARLWRKLTYRENTWYTVKNGRQTYTDRWKPPSSRTEEWYQ